MPRYEITFANGYGREIDTMVITAASMALALTVSGNLLLAGAVTDGEQAVSATVELLGVYECEVDESAGQRENVHTPEELAWQHERLHSVRAELHEDAGLLDLHPIEGVDTDAVARLEEFAHGLGEIDTNEHPSTGRS